MAITCGILRKGYITLKVYNCAGKEVKTLVNRDVTAGFYTSYRDARDNAGNELPGGIYFCRLEAGDFATTRKMTIIK